MQNNRDNTLNKIIHSTSKLGFGCVGMTTHKTKEDALLILETAYEYGIKHFDVARLYGFGQAEGILGDFVKRHRDSITITTKFGLNPPHMLTQYQGLLNILRQAKRRLSFAEYLFKKTPNKVIKNRAFSVIDAKKSLETSLKELKTDYLDFWLLHECLLEDAANHELLGFLDRMVLEGKILNYGVGTNFSNIQDILNLKPCHHQVIQFEHSLFHQNIQRLHDLGNKLVITHSVFKEANQIIEASQQHPKLTKKYSDQIGLDLSRKQQIMGLLLAYAVFVNPNGIVLFSSTQPNHIYNNIKMFNEIKYPEQIFEIFLNFLEDISSFQE